MQLCVQIFGENLKIVSNPAIELSDGILQNTIGIKWIFILLTIINMIKKILYFNFFVVFIFTTIMLATAADIELDDSAYDDFDKGCVAGYVFYGYKPLKNIKVILNSFVGEHSSKISSTKTDSSGKYVFCDISNRTYTVGVTVESSKFKSSKKDKNWKQGPYPMEDIRVSFQNDADRYYYNFLRPFYDFHLYRYYGSQRVKPVHNGQISLRDAKLQWSKMRDAKTYFVTVFEPQDGFVFKQFVSDNSVIIPENVLKSGKKYAWSVSGYREEYDNNSPLLNTPQEAENMGDYIEKNANLFKVGTLKSPEGQADFNYGDDYTFTVQ